MWQSVPVIKWQQQQQNNAAYTNNFNDDAENSIFHTKYNSVVERQKLCNVHKKGLALSLSANQRIGISYEKRSASAYFNNYERAANAILRITALENNKLYK